MPGRVITLCVSATLSGSRYALYSFGRQKVAIYIYTSTSISTSIESISPSTSTSISISPLKEPHLSPPFLLSFRDLVAQDLPRPRNWIFGVSSCHRVFVHTSTYACTYAYVCTYTYRIHIPIPMHIRWRKAKHILELCR